MDLFVATCLKMFFIMTPFFVLSVFLTMTSDATTNEKKTLAIKVTLSVIVISLVLLFFGKHIFEVFGITLDAFRIGAGALLFLSAVELIRGSKDGQKLDADNIQDIAVVPLAIPITIGPGTVGILLVMGAGFKSALTLFIGSFALICSVSLIGLMLYFSHVIIKVVGRQGLLIVSKITGLFLAALSAQTMFTGIRNFLNM